MLPPHSEYPGAPRVRRTSSQLPNPLPLYPPLPPSPASVPPSTRPPTYTTIVSAGVGRVVELDRQGRHLAGLQPLQGQAAGPAAGGGRLLAGVREAGQPRQHGSSPVHLARGRRASAPGGRLPGRGGCRRAGGSGFRTGRAVCGWGSVFGRSPCGGSGPAWTVPGPRIASQRRSVTTVTRVRDACAGVSTESL